MNLLARLYRCRWPFARLLVAVLLIAFLVLDRSAHLARLRLAALPDIDLAAEVRTLGAQGRLAEAIALADAGLDQPDSPQHAPLRAERDRLAAEQASWIRKAKEVGLGAITGRGDSLERLLGAVGADFFILGDVRDLFLQGAELSAGNDPDELIIALSAAGLATTLAPEIDWVPSLLKAAKKAGALSKPLESAFLGIIRSGDKAAAAAVCADVGTLARSLSPGGALRLIRHADNPADLRALAAFAERHGSRATLALHSSGQAALPLLRAADEPAQAALLAAARKGPPGSEWARTFGRVAFKPHPILGVLKGLTKGTLPDLAQRAVERLGPQAWWLLPLLGLWALLELAMIAARIRAR